MPTVPATRPRSQPLLVDQGALTSAVAGVVLDQLRDLFGKVTINADVSIPPIRLQAPVIPTPEFHFSPAITTPPITVNPQIDARPDMSELASVMSTLTDTIRDLIAFQSRPIRRHVVRNSAGEITDMIEERG